MAGHKQSRRFLEGIRNSLLQALECAASVMQTGLLIVNLEGMALGCGKWSDLESKGP